MLNVKWALACCSGLSLVSPLICNATLIASGSAIPNNFNLTATSVSVGNYGTGSLTLNSESTGNGISHLTANSLTVGQGAGSKGTLNVIGDGTSDSATITVNEYNNNYLGVIVANGGAGIVNIENGGAVYANENNILFGGGDTNGVYDSSVTITGEYSIIKTTQSSSGDNGGRIRIGNGSGTASVVNVLDGGRLEASGANTGNDSYDDGSIWIGTAGPGSDSVVVVSGQGSEIIASDYLQVDSAYANEYAVLDIVNNGSVTVSDGRDDFYDLAVASHSDGGTALIYINGSGSVLNANEIGIEGNGVIEIDNGGTVNSELIDVSSNREYYNTTKKAVLNIRNGSTVNGDVNVYKNGVLKGNGTVNGDVTLFAFGVLAPGNSPGTLTVAGDLILNGGVVEIELSNDNLYDIFDVSGEIYVGNDVEFDIILNYLPDDTILISKFFTNYSKLTFDDLFNPLTNIVISGLSGGSVDIDYFGKIYTYTENGAFLNNTSPVPEPNTFVLFMIGVIGLFGCQRLKCNNY